LTVPFSRRALAAAVALLAFGCSLASAQQPPPIRVGAFVAATGGASFLGAPELNTLRLYVDRINRAGGVLGRQLQLSIYDSAGDARQAVTFVRRLIEEDHVDFIVGGSTTGETMAVLPLIAEAQVPFISLAGANVVVTPVAERRWVFKTPHSDTMAVQKIFEDMKRDNLVRAAVLGGPGGFDQSCRAEAQRLAPQYGIQIVMDETYGANDTDMTPQLTRIRNAGNVQAIVGCGFGAPTVITARNYRQLGMQSIRFYFNHGVASPQFIEQSGGAAEGIRVPVAALLVADQLPADDPQRAVSQDYEQIYRAAFNEPISTFGGHARDALMIALEAVRRAGGTDRARVRDEIERTTNFVGVDGLFNMSPQDHMGLDLRSFRMVEIRNNGWHLLY
jgi:branched-chain amino acid transport system substrate-binding protein